MADLELKDAFDSALAALTTPERANDRLTIYDASADAMKQISPDNLLGSNLKDICELADPNADKILFWDDSAGGFRLLSVGTNLTITGTTLDAAGGGGGGSALVYDAQITQTGTGEPTATVGENTLGGTVVWTRSATGVYHGTLAGAFAGTVIGLVSYNFVGSADLAFVGHSTDIIQILTKSFAGGAVDLDGCTVYLSVKVY